MDKVTRIGVSLDPDLLLEFDGLIERKGYGSRSEALRDLIRDALAEEEWKNPEEEVVGTITLIYDHHTGGVKEKLMELQHHMHHLISSSIHVHLDLDRCLEILLVNGKLKDLKKLSEELMSIRGVLRGKLTMASTTTTHMHHIGHLHGHE